MRFLVLTIILFISEIIFIKVAKQFKVTDISREHHIDSKDTVRGGGIIFFLSILCYYVYSGFQYSLFFLGLTVLSMVSLMDDIKSLSIINRLFFHFLSVILILAQLNFSTNSILFYICTLIVSVGIINAYNFMDGINGITGGYSTVVIGGLWYVNNYYTEFIENDFITFVFISLQVFNFFNFRTKARCFAGDVGSMSIALIILFLLLKLILIENNLIYILFLSVYGLDSILTIIERLILKENIFKTHRLHLFQLLVDKLNIPPIITSLIYMTIQIIICGIIITFLSTSFEAQLMVSVGIISSITTLYIIIKRKISSLTV
jgi:UDP-GlcNAc:undecaprenyl-phosphate/decaprenyl-phosphate GlcNAc-1-phosphate transferase